MSFPTLKRKLDRGETLTKADYAVGKQLLDESLANASAESRRLKAQLSALHAKLDELGARAASARRAPAAERVRQAPQPATTSAVVFRSAAELNAPKELIRRSEFNKLTPRAAADFCARGGKIID